MTTRAETPEQFKEAPLLDHLEELRYRILYAVGAWALASVAGWFLVERIYAALKHPVDVFQKSGGNVQVVATGVTDKLMIAFQIAAFAGLVIAMPFVVYQVWAFVAPGLTRTERRWGGPFVLGLGLSFGLGILFAYSVIVPAAIPFLLGFGPLADVPNILNLGQYITTVTLYLAVFGLLFLLPLTMFLLGKVGLVNPRFLSTYRRHAILFIVVVSAVITPTVDPINLSLMAGPLWLLYELGIVLVRIAQRPGRKPALENE
jgi:sec-independent protein translocase protein TatC